MINLSGIKVLLFDLGNVIFEIDRQRTLDYFAEILDDPRIREDTDPLPMDVYFRFEKGQIDYHVLMRHLEGRWQKKIREEDFIHGFNLEIVRPVAGVEELLLQAKKSFHLSVLSNTNAVHIHFVRKKYPEIISHFHTFFTSYELQSRKPEGEIFRIAAHRLGVEPENILFMDDREENIHAAGNLGFTTLHVPHLSDMHRTIKYLQNHRPEQTSFQGDTNEE